jgi:tetratricopeptide (TPR) repeat protein
MNKFLIPTFSLFISIAALAQKNEIKYAQSQFNNGNLQGALTSLKASEYLIVNAKDDDKSEFYNLKAKVLTNLADKNIETAKNLSLAVSAYQELLTEEANSGNLKYSVLAIASIKDIKNKLSNSAYEDIKNNKDLDGANKMYYLYLMDKKDTLNLFNSASYFLSAKEYDLALKSYKELKALNYSGKGMGYYALNKKSNLEEAFSSIKARDLSISAGFHEKPRNVVSPSKKTEIYKNIAFIYSEKGDLKTGEDYYKMIIDFDPQYINAYTDLAYLYLDEKKRLVDEMSVLGTSPKDMKLYDEIKVKKDQVLKNAIAYLEKGNRINPKDTEVKSLLLNLYRALDLTAEYNALKARI